jgi:hypothetical protein
LREWDDPAVIKGVAVAWLLCALAERDVESARAALAALGENFFGYDAVRFHREFGEGAVAGMEKAEAKAHAPSPLRAPSGRRLSRPSRNMVLLFAYSV